MAHFSSSFSSISIFSVHFDSSYVSVIIHLLIDHLSIILVYLFFFFLLLSPSLVIHWYEVKCPFEVSQLFSMFSLFYLHRYIPFSSIVSLLPLLLSFIVSSLFISLYLFWSYFSSSFTLSHCISSLHLHRYLMHLPIFFLFLFSLSKISLVSFSSMFLV